MALEEYTAFALPGSEEKEVNTFLLIKTMCWRQGDSLWVILFLANFVVSKLCPVALCV